MIETKVEAYIWGLLVGFFIGFMGIPSVRSSIGSKNWFEYVMLFLGLALVGMWFLVYVIHKGDRNDR